MTNLSRGYSGLLARAVTKVEILNLQGNELSKQHVLSIITAVSLSNKISSFILAGRKL